MRCIASHTASRWRVPASLMGRSKWKAGFSRYCCSCTQARNAIVSRGGANPRTDGARKRMPVTYRSVAVMPSVANGVRTHAWNPAALASGIRSLSGQRANLRHQLRRHRHALALRALAILAAPLARQAHFIVGEHRLDQGLHALVVHAAPGERARVDGENRLADARGPSLVGEEAV